MWGSFCLIPNMTCVVVVTAQAQLIKICPFFFLLRVMVHMHIDIKAESNIGIHVKRKISTKNCSIPYEEGSGHA